MVDVLKNALSPIVTAPDFEPLLAGVNVTLIWQFAPGARVVVFVQVVPEAKAKLPLIFRLERINDVVPEFVSVTDFAALVVLVFWLPKLRLLALSDATGLMTVAVMGIDCGLPAALSVMTRFAACVLVTFESLVKLMMMVQLFPAFKVLGQSSTPRNPEESSPEIEPTLKFVKVIIEVPVLVSVVVRNEGMPT